MPRPLQLSFQGVYRLAPNHVPGDEPELVVDRYLFSQANGLTFSPCQRWMWVNDTERANIRLFDVTPKGLENGRLFAGGIQDRLKPGLPDGMKADKDGNIYVTAPGGVWVYAFDGRLIGKINCPEMVANLHWGGDDWSTLFLCATGSLYSVQTLTRAGTNPSWFPAPRRAAPAPHRLPRHPPRRQPVGLPLWR